MAKNLKIHVKLAHAQDKYVSFNMKILVIYSAPFTWKFYLWIQKYNWILNITLKNLNSVYLTTYIQKLYFSNTLICSSLTLSMYLILNYLPKLVIRPLMKNCYNFNSPDMLTPFQHTYFISFISIMNPKGIQLKG